MGRVTLRQLEYFVAAAETGSVTAAAEQMYLSQSAVSTALVELEESLGLQLFIRHARGLTVTPGGRQILSESRLLLRQVDELHNTASDLSGSYSGRLSIGCYGTLAPLLLPRIVSNYLAAHPAVDLDLTTGSNAELRNRLREGTCDIALLYDFSSAKELMPADLTKIVLKSYPPYVALPAHHPLTRLREVPLEKLAKEPMVLFDLPPGGEYFESLFAQKGIKPSVRFRSTDFELVRGLVARGVGYALLTQHTGIDVSYENMGIETRPLTGFTQGLAVVAAHLARSHLTRRMAAFLEECQRSLCEQPPGVSAGRLA